MANEFVHFASTSLQSKFTIMASVPAGIALLLGWSLGGKAAGIAWAVTVLVISSLIWFVKRNNAVYAAAQSDLAVRGYNTDFQVGNALIDSKSKIIAFVDLASCSYDLYSARDILGWEHQWVNKTTAALSAWGTHATARTREVSNVIVFKTNNPNKPIYKVPVASHRVGEEWMARLGAIINN